MNNLNVFSGFLLASLCNICMASDVVSSYSEARGKARITMDETYGENNYIKKYDCWRYQIDEDMMYCMSLNSVTLTSQNNVDYLYVLASNEMGALDSDYPDDYSRGVSGLVVAFIFKKDNKQWVKVASNTEYVPDWAHFGATGAEGAVLTELGKDYWGWLFSNGNQAMGSVNYRYTILAKVNSSIEDITGGVLPETCDAGLEFQGGLLYKYKISINKNPKDKVYPITLKEYKQDASKDITQTKFIKSYISTFDTKKWKYVAPSTFCNKSM